jgi:hypothetical protein
VPPLSRPALSHAIVGLRRWEEGDADVQVAAFADSLFIRFSDRAPITRDEVIERLTVLATSLLRLHIRFKDGRRDSLVFPLLAIRPGVVHTSGAGPKLPSW